MACRGSSQPCEHAHNKVWRHLQLASGSLKFTVFKVWNFRIMSWVFVYRWTKGGLWWLRNRLPSNCLSSQAQTVTETCKESDIVSFFCCCCCCCYFLSYAVRVWYTIDIGNTFLYLILQHGKRADTFTNFILVHMLLMAIAVTARRVTLLYHVRPARSHGVLFSLTGDQFWGGDGGNCIKERKEFNDVEAWL